LVFAIATEVVFGSATMVKGMVTSKLELHNISDMYLAGICRNILLSMVTSNSSQISLQISKTKKKKLWTNFDLDCVLLLFGREHCYEHNRKLYFHVIFIGNFSYAYKELIISIFLYSHVVFLLTL
jgi:hypothetical protein